MNNPPLAAAQQPNLRAYIVYDHAPEGCISFEITDVASEPLLRCGDVVVIDTSQREPANGELFLIEWNNGTRQVVETFSQPCRYGCGPNGEFIESLGWYVGNYARPRSREQMEAALTSGRAARVSPFCDGPYATEGPRAGALDRKLVGLVVGILEQSADEPRRIIQ